MAGNTKEKTGREKEKMINQVSADLFQDGVYKELTFKKSSSIADSGYPFITIEIHDEQKLTIANIRLPLDILLKIVSLIKK